MSYVLVYQIKHIIVQLKVLPGGGMFTNHKLGTNPGAGDNSITFT